MIKRFDEIKDNQLLDVAEKMAIAARTAPKARGIDNLEILILTGDHLVMLSEKMKEISSRDQVAFFSRDAENVLQSSVVILIGVKYKSLGLKNCGWCGWNTCDEKEKHPDHPCAYNLNDLGIAVGSSVSVAANHRVDNRVMFSVGKAAVELGLFSTEVRAAFGIPLSASNKSPFFDRKPI